MRVLRVLAILHSKHENRKNIDENTLHQQKGIGSDGLEMGKILFAFVESMKLEQIQRRMRDLTPESVDPDARVYRARRNARSKIASA